MTLRVLHPERVAFELLDFCCAQLAPKGVFVVQEDVALPVARLAGERLVPVRVLQPQQQCQPCDSTLCIQVGRSWSEFCRHSGFGTGICSLATRWHYIDRKLHLNVLVEPVEHLYWSNASYSRRY